MAAGKKDSIKEPSVVIKPLGRMGGLDGIHLAMIVLIVILVGLLIAVAYTKPLPLIITNSTSNSTSNLTCAYGALNGKCQLPINSPSQIKQDAESFLAGYNNVNTSLSLLPYISNVSEMNVSYNPAKSEWYVTVPVQSPYNSETLQFSMLINDKNTSEITPLLQTMAPTSSTNNFVVSKGVIQIAGQPACAQQVPLQVYWFVDPYSPGGISSLLNMSALQNQFQSKISANLEILFSQSSQNIAQSSGLNNSLALGRYLFCASNQSSFSGFVNQVNVYDGSYLSPSILSGIANKSNLNINQLNTCLATAGTLINRQAILAKYYNITSTPSIVTDCQYLSIPQTEVEAIHYANSSIT